MEIILAILGMLVGLVLLVFISPFYKSLLSHNPAEPGKLTWMIEVAENHSVVIQRGNKPIYVIRGGEFCRYDVDGLRFVESESLWLLYRKYVWKVSGLHVFTPFFTGPTVYDLPRYDVKEKDGHKILKVVEETSARYRSNHVRTEITTWYFEYKGAEINKIPFTIKGSAQIEIPEGKEVDALYKTDAWNLLLDQALNASIRSVARRSLTLDMVMGSIAKNIWQDDAPSDADAYKTTANLIEKELDEYTIDGEKLEEICIKIHRVDIIDFEDELEDSQREQLYAAVIAREEARATELRATAEATAIRKRGGAEADVIRIKGKATADSQKLLADVNKDNPNADTTLMADALVKASQSDSGLLNALMIAFTGKQLNKKDK